MKKVTIRISKKNWLENNINFILNYKNWEILKNVEEWDLTKLIENYLKNDFEILDFWFKDNENLTIDFNLIDKDTIFYSSRF